MKKPSKLLPRLLILPVLLWNLQCAFAFLLFPGTYAGGFELTGPVGDAMVQGMGLLFLMWNVPYAVALASPFRHKISLYESTAMQAIGFVGEAALFASLPVGHPALRASISRFLWFDGAGLVLLLVALLYVRQKWENPPPSTP